MVWQRVTKGMQQSPKQCEVHRFVQAGPALSPNIQIVTFHTSVTLFICFAYIFEKNYIFLSRSLHSVAFA